MSETEEPPTKVQKVELSLGEVDGDVEGEGQEEWLSEGILTDEDQNVSQIKSDPENTTCDESSQQSVNTTEAQNQVITASDQQIELTLDTMESSTVEIPEELGDFLVRKPEKKVINQENLKQSEDDGNDTDDLLRMLGEEDKNKKKQVLRSIKERSKARDQAVLSSDDELGIKKTIIKKAPLSKSVVVKQSTKAMDELSTECETSDDEMMVKNMFKTSYSKPTRPGGSTGDGKRSKVIRKEVRKPESKPQVKIVQVKKTPSRQTKNETAKAEKTAKVEMENNEMINEAEFLEDDNIDLDDDFVNNTNDDRQGIMRPDAMDEDAPSDDDSKSDYDTMYDEFPTSGSEDEFEDWFHMDIRAETAGDFLPLLGSKAYELLNEEKKRVAERVAKLKQNLATLAMNGKKQNEELNKATLTLADLDAMLAAS